MNPQISVIVPIYNVEQYLPVCIESILAQTFPDWEMILVNDGSPDNSWQICQQYRQQDSRIRLVTKENGGLSSARNAGLEVARGQYVMFVDSDDYVEPDCLESAYTAICRAGADLYIGGFYEYYEKENRKTPKCIARSREYSVQELLNRYEIDYPSHWVSLAWGKLYKRQIIQENHLRFDTTLRYKEDAPFVYTYMGFADKVFFDAKPICCYRLFREGALNLKVHTDMYAINCKVYKIKRDLMIQKQCPARVYNQVYFTSLLKSMEYYYIDNRPERVACRRETIANVCKNELLPQITLRQVSGMKRKLMLVLCKTRAKRLIDALYRLRSGGRQ